ncbi:MAG: PQQ-like beta-propeller repeat protein [Planctomycetaceae bacterium]|nr:PQQ-like beta-propeller repeat protein [Planctomycetales bacterium]MCB9872722.1 PQQ-like beta-propeller repeat protein [Planctomycetaceae bacterium]MCB9926208.1 PQQ-like beta-propeller repeat protein [Planctomycetaceae bacterium]
MRTLSLVLIFLGSTALPTVQADWTEFRGPGGQGFVGSANVPLTWSETEHVAWKTEIAGKAWSSPVVLGQQIWVTTAITNEPTPEQIEQQFRDSGLTKQQFERRQVHGTLSLKAICIDRKDGRLVRDIELFEIDSPEAIHTANSYASPTPIIESDRVYCHFGSNGTACLDTTNGHVVWSRKIATNFSVGAGSSPVIYGNVLVLVCDGIDVQFITGLDKRTGETLWTTPRPPIRAPDGQQQKAYSTPLLVQQEGRDQYVIPGAQWVVSYDPATGEELWRFDHGAGFSNVPRPVYGHGMVYICTGFGKPELVAIRVDGHGDVTQTHMAWRAKGQIPAKPSPVLVDDLLFVIGDTGIATCFDAHTGKDLWKRRIGGNYSASPIATQDRVYFFSEEGDTTVIRAAPEYAEIATSHVDGKLMASPAVLDSTLFLRSDSQLYRIE